MNVLSANLVTPRVSLLPLENQVSQRFLEILARGAIRYCVKNRIEIPATYDEFLRDIVNAAKREGKNGTFLIQDQREINAIYELFGVDMKENNSKLIEQLMMLATVKSTRTAPVEKELALETFGSIFYELARAFGSGVCHNRLAFEKMKELMLRGEPSLIYQEEGISPIEKREFIDPELLRAASNPGKIGRPA